MGMGPIDIFQVKTVISSIKLVKEIPLLRKFVKMLILFKISLHLCDCTKPRAMLACYAVFTEPLLVQRIAISVRQACIHSDHRKLSLNPTLAKN